MAGRIGSTARHPEAAWAAVWATARALGGDPSRIDRAFVQRGIAEPDQFHRIDMLQEARLELAESPRHNKKTPQDNEKTQ